MAYAAGIVTGLVMLAAAGLFGYRFCRSVVVTTRTKRWPVTRGTILRSALGVTKSEHGRGLRFLEPRIEYRYAVKGCMYQSTAVRAAYESFGSNTAVERLVARYQVGLGVPVYYNPLDPSQAALELATTWGDWVMLAMAAGCAGLGVLALAAPWLRG